MNKRITEIDFIRGMLLVLMVVYHLCFDLYFYYDINLPMNNEVLKFLQLFFASGFVLICGISSTLSKNNLKRGIILLFIALLISLGTYIYDNSLYVRFGIIHFLGVAIIFSHFIKRLNYKKCIGLLLVFLVITFILKTMKTDNIFGFILGVPNNPFASLDYFPIFGNINVFMIGILIGKLVYQKRENRFIRIKENNILVYVGRKSLLIYLLHQPLILLILMLVMRK